MSKYGVFSGPYFPVLGLNTEIYTVNLRIQSEDKKIQTRKYSVFGHFSRSETFFDGFFSIPEFLDSGRKCWTLGSGRWAMDSEC